MVYLVGFQVLTAASLVMVLTFWVVGRVFWYKFIDFSEVLSASIIRTGCCCESYFEKGPRNARGL
jgi:hypothetical protein